ncbi:hypothetical protein [Kitasatospora sp. NPDC007106]|uniref:hypothetical protein n=1 Tax=Kitasatospora sp. NPDC007106 TaxID=3156914 RepID=UPI0033E236BF
MRNPLARVLAALPAGTPVVAAGTVVLGAASYVHLGVAGHSLSVDAMANVSVLWTIVMSIGIGVFFPIEQELTRIVAARAVLGHGALPVLRKAALLTGGILAATLAVLAAASRPIADSFFHGDLAMVAALGAAFVGLAAGYLTRGILAGLGRFTAYGTQLGVDGGLRMGLAFGCAAAGAHTALAFSLILAVAPLVSVLVTLPPLVRVLRPGPAIAWRDLSRGLWLLICSTLLAQLVVNAVVLSTQLLEPTAVALIAALLNALVLARVPLFVFGSLQASLLSGLSSAAAAGDRPAFNQLLRRSGAVICLLGGAGGAVAVALGPWLIRVLFAAPPVLGGWDFLWLSLGTLFYMLAMLLGQALMVLDRHRFQLLGWVLGTACLVGVTLLPGPIATRTELAYFAGSAVTCLGMLAALRPARRTSSPNPPTAVLDRV